MILMLLLLLLLILPSILISIILSPLVLIVIATLAVVLPLLFLVSIIRLDAVFQRQASKVLALIDKPRKIFYVLAAENSLANALFEVLIFAVWVAVTVSPRMHAAPI